jgi:hypothetical protein
MRILILIILLLPFSANAQKIYDSSNRYMGRIECSGNICRTYDSSNRLVERSERRSNGDVYYYDSGNRLIKKEIR